MSEGSSSGDRAATGAERYCPTCDRSFPEDTETCTEDGTRLVRQLRRDDRSLGGIGNHPEHVVATTGLDGVARFILLPADETATVVANGDLRRLASALGHKDQVDAQVVQAPRFPQGPLQRVVRLTIGEQYQHAVRDFRTGLQQIDAL